MTKAPGVVLIALLMSLACRGPAAAAITWPWPGRPTHNVRMNKFWDTAVADACTFAEYTFEADSAADMSGNGNDGILQGPSWTPRYVAGHAGGRAIHFDSPSGVYAGSGNSWFVGPYLPSGAFQQFLGIQFWARFMGSGVSPSTHTEVFLGLFQFTASGAPDYRDYNELLCSGRYNQDLVFGSIGGNEPGDIEVLSGNIYDQTWRFFNITSDDPCSSAPSVRLEIDGVAWTRQFSGSLCDRNLVLNKHCWRNGCSARVEFQLDDMEIRTCLQPPTPVPTLSPTDLPTSSPTSNPTAAPTEATPSPTSSPTAAPTDPVSAKGDPHLVNMFGQRFDLYQTGVHVLLQVPWQAKKPADSLLRVEAEARRLGGACADLYFEVVNITGSWTIESGGLQFFANIELDDGYWRRFGDVDLKVVRGHTGDGVPYLNVLVKHLDRVKFPVGGLLGEDDHTAAMTPPPDCGEIVDLHSKHLSRWSKGEARSPSSSRVTSYQR